MKRLDHFEERLGKVTLFRACSKQDLRRIARLADPDDVKEGETLVSEGQQGKELFVIISGNATVIRKGRKVATLGPGDYFGELAVLNPAPRTATVKATTPMEVLIVRGRELGVLLADVPIVARKLLAGMALRLQEADSKVFSA
ncbi:MAG: cyclic nucleotide-binding domain-containing protein [Acidimicrobiia bacterium]|nr:cyclic nucleotide-binding domain-containing protein [Acidimicrobiia bacterium]MBV9040053.1 cyclic nucleotide-binding domain-containing protein [Acidimicrobiia bacterium]